MYAYSIFLIFLLRGAEANRKSSLRLQIVIYEDVPEFPAKCDEPTLTDAVLGCRFFNKTYNYNDKVVRDRIEYVCNYSKDACKLTMVPVHCLLGGARVEPGAGFAMGQLYYMCSLNENSTGIKPIGCATEGGMLVQIGQRYRFGTSAFHCQASQGKIKPVFIGCDYGNGIVEPGNTYNDGKATVQCQQGTKIQFLTKQNNYANNQGERGSHVAHTYSTVRLPTKPMLSMGNGRLKPVITGEQKGWFCMDSSISTACQFSVSGKRYSFGRGHGQWIGQYIFFCDVTVYEGARLCMNFLNLSVL